MTFIFSTEGNAKTFFKLMRETWSLPTQNGIGDQTQAPGSWEVINKYLLNLLTCVMETSMNMLLENWVFCRRLLSLLLEEIWRIPPLQYSCLENPMDGGAWWAAVHGVAKSWTRLSDFTFAFHFHALEKEMATHSSVLAWRIPGTAEPGGLPSMGLHRVGHDWSDLEVVVGGEERLHDCKV